MRNDWRKIIREAADGQTMQVAATMAQGTEKTEESDGGKKYY